MGEHSEQAQAAIGRDDPGSDWRLAPGAHAAALPMEAGALRRILQHPEIQSIVITFETADKQAVNAQARYKRVARLRLYAGVVATIVGATFVLPLDQWFRDVLSIPAAIQYGCLAISIVAALHLVRSKPFDAWMKARAKAEIARIDLFNHVMTAIDDAPQPGELPLLPLKLEYFLRYQLDVQLRYYKGRGEQHARAAGETARWQRVSVVLTGLAGTIAVISATKFLVDFAPLPGWIKDLSQIVQSHLPPWTNKAVLTIGIVSSTLFGASISRSLMDLDERNASRYLTTAANLELLRATGLEAARRSAAAGLMDKVQNFVDQIQDQISTEHREWILLGDNLPGKFKRGASVQVR
jgi:SMODS and SLOG-associating 2TM effector domain 3